MDKVVMWIMYQAWVVQKFNGVPYNVVLGEHYETIERACESIYTYERFFGKCESSTVEPSGTPIPVTEQKKESLLALIRRAIW